VQEMAQQVVPMGVTLLIMVQVVGVVILDLEGTVMVAW